MTGRAAPSGAESVHTSACPRNCYSTCGLRVTVRDGRIRAIAAHPDNRATRSGVCLKGLSYIDRVYAPDRLLAPRRRTPDGSTVDISWDEAFDLLAERMTGLGRSHGAQSILFYAGSGTKGLLNGVAMEFWRRFGGCTSTYGDLCWPAGLEATRLTLGDNRHNVPWDLENARLIIIWGKNPAETNVHQMGQVATARRRGARLVVIDPRRTETSERAELLIQPRPGSDGALALGLARLLIENDWIDSDFIAGHVHGFEEFASRAGGYDPARVARLTGVPEAALRRLAGWIGQVRPMTIVPGFGMQRYSNSGQTMRAMLALVALTGQIGKPGSGWMYANLQTAVFSQPRDPLAFYPPPGPPGQVRVSVSVARLGPCLQEADDPPIRMAWVERANPLAQNPETNTLRRAWRELDFRVVVDQFMTDTAREADLVLPAKTMFEQSDVIGAYWHPYLQFKQKLIEPPGLVKPETEIYRLLAQRLGLPAAGAGRRIPGPGDEDIEAWLEERLRKFPGLSLEKLRRGPLLAPGAEEIAFAGLDFPTPSGKIELLSEEAARRWNVDPLPDFSEPVESSPSGTTPAFPLLLLTPNSKNRIHSQFANLESLRPFSGRPVLEMAAADARARGIADGDRVRVFNDRGEFRLPVRIDFSLRAGCLSVGNGWWTDDGVSVNVCSAARETDMGHGAAFHDNLVEVERLP